MDKFICYLRLTCPPTRKNYAEWNDICVQWASLCKISERRSLRLEGQGRWDCEMPAGNNQPDSRELLEPPTTKFSASVVGRWEFEGYLVRTWEDWQRTKTWTPVSQEMLLPKMPENIVQIRIFSGWIIFCAQCTHDAKTPKRRCIRNDFWKII